MDLRGLGPNHTLVLVNGRRIADFPLPYLGQSNFTDISNIPVGLIEKVEILSGAGSAIYGSDAIAGVVNFKMKEKLDGVTLDYRHGRTQHGGGNSHRFTATGGWSTDRFSFVGGVEYLRQDPLWGYQRKIQDSTDDSLYRPTPRRTFVQIYAVPDEDGEYEDFYASPPSGNCDLLSHLNGGSVQLYNRSGYGEFCGSKTSVGNGTIISQRRGFNSFGSMKYELSDAAKLFVDFQFGISKVKLMYDSTSWGYEQSSSSADNYFFNRFTGRVEDWGRQFTPEETGGFEMQSNKQTTYSITPGVRDEIGKGWDYEASFNYSRYQSTVSWPQIIASKANQLFLGDQDGFDDGVGGSGYPVFDADPDRLFRALTRDEYESISADTVYRP